MKVDPFEFVAGMVLLFVGLGALTMAADLHLGRSTIWKPMALTAALCLIGAGVMFVKSMGGLP